MMIFVLKILNKREIYIIFLALILLIIPTNYALSKTSGFIIKNLEVSEEFNLKFKKEDVIEKAFQKAFNQLLFKILVFKDYNRIKSINLNQIKPLVENFKIKNEKFQDNKYFANFEIKFNKKEIFNFLEKKQLFHSIPTNLDVVILPIFIENDNFKIFNYNLFYSNWLSKKNENYLLNYILPLEDIDDFEKLINTKNYIENFDMVKFSEKYNSENYVLSLIYKNENKLNKYSKIKFKDNVKNSNFIIENINLNDISLVQSYIDLLKVHYEDIWKKQNEINTSIKLTLEIVLNSNDFKKIQKFENTLNNIYLINSFNVKKFNLKRNIYEIIYNGNPSSLISRLKDENIILTYENNKWIVNEK